MKKKYLRIFLCKINLKNFFSFPFSSSLNQPYCMLRSSVMLPLSSNKWHPLPPSITICWTTWENLWSYMKYRKLLVSASWITSLARGRWPKAWIRIKFLITALKTWRPIFACILIGRSSTNIPLSGKFYNHI